MMGKFKVNLRTCFYVLIFIMAKTLPAQTAGDFRSATTGNWTTTSTWETFDGVSWVAASRYPGQPPIAELTTIKSGHVVTLDADLSGLNLVSMNNIIVELGATLTDNPALINNYQFNVMNKLTVIGVVNMTATGTSTSITAPDLLIQSSGKLTVRRIIFTTASNNGTATLQSIVGTTSGKTWVNEANSTLNMSGPSIVENISAAAIGNTVNYNSSSASQTIKLPLDSYYNLTLSGGGTNKTLSGNTTVLGNLAIAGSASFRLSSFNLSVAGDWNNSSSNGSAFVSGTGTVTLNGSSTQRIINTGNASGTRINRLTISNTSATAPQINVLTDVTVGNTLTMTSVPGVVNLINLNNKKIQLGSGSTAATLIHSGNSSTGWFCNGDIVRIFNSNATIPTGTNDGFFPVGTSTNFRPFYVSSSTVLTSTPVATLTCPPSTSTYSKENIPDTAGEILKLALSGWRIQLTNGTGGDFSVNAGGAGIGIIGDVNDLRLSQLTAAAGLPGVNTGTSASPMVQRTGLTATDMTDITFYVGSVNLASSPLPIQLVSFTGQAEGSTVNLHWITQSERNCDYFMVYRSSDAKDFVKIGTIKGQGTTKSTINYELQDKSPLKGINYYRLSQTDLDGSTYSLSLTSVEANGGDVAQVYPNPIKAGQVLHVNLHGATQLTERDIQLINAVGQVIDKYKITFDENGDISGDLKIDFLPAGLYFIRINKIQLKLLIE